jgi:oxygen-independent coproporphyrinogen III oxidase
MAGIYIHIPYCRKACNYCNFHFSTNLKTKSDLIQCLVRQISEDNFVKERDISTIYFGGGTPSLLSSTELNVIMRSIYDNFQIEVNAEITLEANPDDVNIETVKLWKEVGINRISLGVQSFYDEDLAFMNRAHNSVQSKNAIELLQPAFENITIDLIYGSITTTLDMWKSNIDTAISYAIPHISSYCLTVEPKTALANLVKKGQVNLDEQKATEQYDILMNKLTDAGYDHYEISNFGKSGYYSKHNTSYWQNKLYHGFGPGAHSYNGQSRKWNIANNALYIQNMLNGQPFYEEEILSEADQYNEYIMTRLRTHWGIDFGYVLTYFGTHYVKYLQEMVHKINPSLILLSEDKIQLSKEGKFFADGIASDLFIVN